MEQEATRCEETLTTRVRVMQSLRRIPEWVQFAAIAAAERSFQLDGVGMLQHQRMKR
jgi:hypothetical protein